jgi:hypothetical protein
MLVEPHVGQTLPQKTPDQQANKQETAAIPGPPKTNADPAIQILAIRAETDPHLEELMKQVAACNASPAQLKEFQSIFAECRAVIERRPPAASEAGVLQAKLMLQDGEQFGGNLRREDVETESQARGEGQTKARCEEGRAIDDVRRGVSKQPRELRLDPTHS